MPVDIPMPRLSDQMEEGTVVRWLVEVGSAVKRGEGLVEIDTDKATMDYEADADGTLVEILVQEGETAAVGAPIARLAPTGKEPEPSAGEESEPTAAESSTGEEPGTGEEPESSNSLLLDGARARPNASPVARRLARELGVDLAAVTGSGPNGLISKEDVQAAAEGAEGAEASNSPLLGRAPAREPLSRLQRTIARRMVEAKEAPDFAVEVEVDVTAAAELRRARAESGAAPSLNDLVVKAAAMALREHPRLNASYSDDGFVAHEGVNVGIAVAIEDGLLVPVVHDADSKPLAELAAETRGLAERVRTGSISPAELEGGTFTVTNLGMLGVRRFTPIIDPPQAAILSVGAAQTLPRYDAEGALQPRSILSLILVSDHRIVYGADAARFLGRVRELLEDPETLS